MQRHAVSFQSFEGRCGSVFQRYRVLFHCGQRFANPDSELASDLTERVEDVLSPCSVDLLLIEGISCVAALGAQAQHILAPEACDGAFQNRGAGSSLADLARDL